MALPGAVDEKEVKTLLKKLLDHSDEVIKFAVVARGPKDGDLILSKKQKLKKKEVQTEAEATNNGGGKVGDKYLTVEANIGKMFMLAPEVLCLSVEELLCGTDSEANKRKGFEFEFLGAVS